MAVDRYVQCYNDNRFLQRSRLTSSTRLTNAISDVLPQGDFQIQTDVYLGKHVSLLVVWCQIQVRALKLYQSILQRSLGIAEFTARQAIPYVGTLCRQEGGL